jgi:hypothetical protein
LAKLSPLPATTTTAAAAAAADGRAGGEVTYWSR